MAEEIVEVKVVFKRTGNEFDFKCTKSYYEQNRKAIETNGRTDFSSIEIISTIIAH